MPLALVTGATGSVGAHIVERLAAAGWQARALVRDVERARWLEQAGATLAPGSLDDGESVARAARGCDVVFHSAAAISSSGGWTAFHATNIAGTDAVIDAAAGAGARLLHVSSVAAYGDAAARVGTVDEDTPFEPLPERAFYARSKRESEGRVLAAHAAGRVWAAAVRPTVVYGRRDRHFVPRVARVLRFGVAPLIGGGTSLMSIVHASSVAEVAVRAATSDRAGGRAYNVVGDAPATVREFFRLAGVGLGRRIGLVSVPLAVARAGIMLVKRRPARARGESVASLSNTTIGFLVRGEPYSGARARAELGWAPRATAAELVPDAFRWWREHTAR